VRVAPPSGCVLRRGLERLWPMHRTLVSDDTDRALGIVHDFCVNGSVCRQRVRLHEFPSGTRFHVDEPEEVHVA